MTYQPSPLRPIRKLLEPNGAPRSDDEKQLALIQAAVSGLLDERDNKIIQRLEKVIERFENGMGRLMETVEAFRSGETDTSIVNFTDSLHDDLPSVSRVKTISSDVYTLSTTEIAKRLGVKPSDVAYLLNANGMDWVGRRPLLWDVGTFKRTKRRMWHHTTATLLTDVLANSEHDERDGLSAGAERVLARCADVRPA
jgi:hypothetical protein